MVNADDGKLLRRVPLPGGFHIAPIFTADGGRLAYVRSFGVAHDDTRYDLILAELSPSARRGGAATRRMGISSLARWRSTLLIPWNFSV